MNNAIEIKNLTKKYDKLTAVSGISFEVQKNEVFGLLGENGAGKTTTLEMIEGLRKPTSGEIIVLNHNFKEGINSIKEKIGVQLQSSAYFNFLTLKEILDLFGSFYSHHLNSLELLKMVGLEDKAKSYVGNLSGGQKQRFSIVASLINDPQIVFLDEPTTGLDPLARRHTWDIITEIKKQGKTIVLTTHYMEEAEMLCDRVAIMEKGKIVALDDTHKLVERAKKPFKLNFYSRIDKNCLEKLQALGEIENVLGKSDHFEMKFKTQANLNQALLLVQKTNPESLTVGRANLEDVFLELTGKLIEE
ncbi:MAG: ABC transporter ATP-binding protein [Patescibacteria group bacterium]|nr:ABC transporter ATP-binding protein [Patescibacteria group bacterium]